MMNYSNDRRVATRSKKGIAIKEVLLIKSKSEMPDVEVPFNFNNDGLEEYINTH